tara:strand:+ start:2965 stop:3789 length:825 start_codon:yes stop_codon:yes gene_type:complete
MGKLYKLGSSRYIKLNNFYKNFNFLYSNLNFLQKILRVINFIPSIILQKFIITSSDEVGIYLGKSGKTTYFFEKNVKSKINDKVKKICFFLKKENYYPIKITSNNLITPYLKTFKNYTLKDVKTTIVEWNKMFNSYKISLNAYLNIILSESNLKYFQGDTEVELTLSHGDLHDGNIFLFDEKFILIDYDFSDHRFVNYDIMYYTYQKNNKSFDSLKSYNDLDRFLFLLERMSIIYLYNSLNEEIYHLKKIIKELYNFDLKNLDLFKTRTLNINL